MVWYGVVSVDFYSAIVTKVSNALMLIQCEVETIQKFLYVFL